MPKENVNVLSGKFNLDLKKSLSPLFSLAKVYVMYVGKNPNGSIITRESVERNLHTLKNIPIVGEYVRENDNFLSHGGSLELEDDTIRFINTTAPIGVVPSDAVFGWETITDEHGEDREYLVVENAYIWNRDSKMVEALKNAEFGQSMELAIEDGEEMADGFFNIKDFYFTALCVLGIDRDGAGYVQPAFDNAKITTYSFENQDGDFAVKLRDMFKEFKFALNEIQNLVEEDTTLNLEGLLEKYSITVEDLEALVENHSEYSIADLEATLAEKLAEKAEKEGEAIKDVEPEKDEDETPEVDVEPEVDPEPTPEPDVETEPEKDEDEDDKTKEYEAQITALVEENKALKSQVESLEGEVTSYEKADHERNCNELIGSFVETYGLDKELAETIDIYELKSQEELESKLFELVGRQAKQKVQTKESSKFSKIKIEQEKDEKINFGFESLFNK